MCKTIVNTHDNSVVIGNTFKDDHKKLNSILSTITNEEIIFTLYLPYLGRDYGIYDVLAFENSIDFTFSSDMYASVELIMGNKRDYTKLVIKLKPEFSEVFNMHQIENYKRGQVGCFIDRELFYCPMITGCPIRSLSLIFPSNELARFVYSVIKSTTQTLVSQASIVENKLPE